MVAGPIALAAGAAAMRGTMPAAAAAVTSVATVMLGVAVRICVCNRLAKVCVCAPPAHSFLDGAQVPSTLVAIVRRGGGGRCAPPS